MLWFRKIIAKIRYRLDCERCYSHMEDAGVAVMGCCFGLAGGDGLDEHCMDCPHLVLSARLGKERRSE